MTLNLDWDAASFSSSNLTGKPYAIFLEGRANESHENQRLGAFFFLAISNENEARYRLGAKNSI